MGFDRLIGTTGSRKTLLPEGLLLLTGGNQFYKFLRNAGFYLAARNSPIVCVELISGYLDYLWSLGN